MKTDLIVLKPKKLMTLLSNPLNITNNRTNKPTGISVQQQTKRDRRDAHVTVTVSSLNPVVLYSRVRCCTAVCDTVNTLECVQLFARGYRYRKTGRRLQTSFLSLSTGHRPAEPVHKRPASNSRLFRCGFCRAASSADALFVRLFRAGV